MLTVLVVLEAISFTSLLVGGGCNPNTNKWIKLFGSHNEYRELSGTNGWCIDLILARRLVAFPDVASN